MHEHIVCWIIASNQAFTEVENPEFHELLKYLRPSAEQHLLGADAYKSRVMLFSLEAKQNLGQHLTVCTYVGKEKYLSF
jgi:hypothetical protein